jgi:hypothetical protein
MDHIDLTTDLPFHPSVWIGVGKEFSESLPLEVLDEKQKILEIPKFFHHSLPPPSTRVCEFIRWALPFQSGDPGFHVSTEWFSNENPHTDPSILLARSIPPRSILEGLNATVGQVWLDGGRSIVDPRFNNGTERFPFWVLSLWNEAQKSIQYQNEWRRSDRWLSSITHPAEVVSQAKGIVGRISWNEPLYLRGATSLDLMGFLGTPWLSDVQIDMMIDILNERMKTEEHAEGAAIESTVFSQEITLVARGSKKSMSKYLSRLANQIQGKHMKTLWFPIHINNSHWITGRVDFERRAFAFGELSARVVNGTIKTNLLQVTR